MSQTEDEKGKRKGCANSEVVNPTDSQKEKNYTVEKVSF